MNLEYFIARRVGATTKKSFSNVIMRIAIAAIALSIATMIIASAMVAGFKHTISEKVFGFWGHIHITNDYNHSNNSSGGIRNPINMDQPYYPFLDTLDKIEYSYTEYKGNQEKDINVSINSGIKHIQIFAKREGIIKTKDQIEGIVLRGVSSDYYWDFLKQYIVEGDTLALTPGKISKEILISKNTAQRLKLGVGDKLLVYFIQSGTTVARKFKVKGIYKTGLEDFDRKFALVDIRSIQKLNNWRPYKNYGDQLVLNERGTQLTKYDLDDGITGNKFNQLLRQYPVRLKGVTSGTEDTWDYLTGRIVEGERFDLNDTATQAAVIPKIIAQERQVGIGDTMQINYLDSPMDDVITLDVVVTGIYEAPSIDLSTIDGTSPKTTKLLFERTIFVHWDFLNNINHRLAPQISGFEIYIDDIEQLEAIEKYIYVVELERRGGSGYPYTIRDMEPVILDWLELTDMNETIILFIMILVAIINMITSLMILILERTNMIGILKALGASNWTVRKVFLYNAAQIIAWGLLIGNVCGIGLCYLQDLYGFIQLPEDLYYVSTAPVDMDALTIIMLNVGTLFITLLVLILPSWLVSKIDPVKAIQFK